MGLLRIIHKRHRLELIDTPDSDSDSPNDSTSGEDIPGSNAEWHIEVLPSVNTTVFLPPDLVTWAFSQAGPPNLALVACGNFSYKGRFVDSIQTHRSLPHVESSATSIGHNGPHIVSSSGHEILKEGLADDVWSFLGAAPMSPLLGIGAGYFVN